jgi:hypothetical protein
MNTFVVRASAFMAILYALMSIFGVDLATLDTDNPSEGLKW